MFIRDILAQKKLSLSFEIFPPKADNAPDTVIQTARELAQSRPDFISVTYGAGGSSRRNTVAIAEEIEQTGVPALAHLTCVGQSRADIDGVIRELQARRIRNVLALRGDIPEGAQTVPGFSHASDLARLLKQAGFCVGGACYPEGHPESRNRNEDIENLKYKAEAGVEFLTTQMFFDNDMLYSFLYRLQSAGIRLPVIAGIMPVTNAAQIQRMVSLSNAYMPRKLLMIIDRFAENPLALRQAGIAYAVDQIIDLVSNGIRGIHIYTMNKSANAADILASVHEIIAAVNGKGADA